MAILKKHQDPIGQAVLDYFQGIRDFSIKVETDIAEDEELSPAYFFRKFEEMPIQEQIALKRCCGKVLDVGAGAGAHSLWLQENGLQVCALDISPLSCQTMQLRGIRQVVCKDVYAIDQEKYDTILLLMNGAGIAQTLPGLKVLLQHLKGLLNPGGKILADSSDLLYLFTDENGEAWIDIGSDSYYGEMEYRLSYRNVKGKRFPWLFVDPETFTNYAMEMGFRVKERILGNHFDYLIELILDTK
ncbi:MAG: class I SAM-dependent methyltransferase [Marinilabiliales bacterium]|nr:class I SAM-dependent methyltransferase [Marinilabiliales bacterium]